MSDPFNPDEYGEPSYEDQSFNPDDYQTSEVKKRNIPVPQIRKWAAAEKENATLRQRLAAMERTQAFIDAGIPADERGLLFRKAYDGPLEPDAVRGEYQKIFGNAPAQQSALQQSLAGHEAAASMASGASSAGTSDLGAALEQMRQEARNRVNWKNGSRKQNAELNALLAREGISPQVTDRDFRVPGQLAGT